MTAVLNEPSQAVMRRLGMTLHGHFEHPRIEPGHPLRPHVAYRMGRPPQGRRQSRRQAKGGNRTDGRDANVCGK